MILAGVFEPVVGNIVIHVGWIEKRNRYIHIRQVSAHFPDHHREIR